MIIDAATDSRDADAGAVRSHPISIPELRALAEKASAYSVAYEQNSDETKETELLAAVESAEQELLDYARHADSVICLLNIINRFISIADKASGDAYRGQGYAVGRARRQTAAAIAAEMRGMMTR